MERIRNRVCLPDVHELFVSLTISGEMSVWITQQHTLDLDEHKEHERENTRRNIG